MCSSARKPPSPKKLPPAPNLPDAGQSAPILNLGGPDDLARRIADLKSVKDLYLPYGAMQGAPPLPALVGSTQQPGGSTLRRNTLSNANVRGGTGSGNYMTGFGSRSTLPISTTQQRANQATAGYTSYSGPNGQGYI